MKVSIIGSGYVGLVSGACFAEMGHEVVCVDNDKAKVQVLRAGGVPIFEPGLEPLLKKHIAQGRIRFTHQTEEGVDHAEIIFIAVPTPPHGDGSVDLTYIEAVARAIGGAMKKYLVVVDKSTVPVKTGEKVTETIKRYNPHGVDFDVVSNPEFLREGSAIQDLLEPDRIVIGVNSKRPVEKMIQLYAPLKCKNIMVTDIASAELIKHASNSFLALKISYINEVARICEAAGANVNEVANGMGFDHRIGRAFLNAGLGYGGSCFPKDLAAFIKIAETIGVDFRLLREVQAINQKTLEHFLKKVRDHFWVLKDKVIAVWGLSFKPNTDDVRQAAAIELIRVLVSEGAKIRAYDPVAMEKAKAVCDPKVEFCKDPYEAAKGAEAVLLVTEWEEFRKPDLEKLKACMQRPVLFDGRNVYDPAELRAAGFTYFSMGRG
jgi:UDPglucose 6-dehydrogenase